MSGKYFQDDANKVSTATFAPCSDSGHRPPRVFFEVGIDGDTMRADPPGATIRCEWGERGSYVTIRSVDKGGAMQHVAEVMVCCPLGEDETSETVAIASALYWSWWRAQDMCGTTHADPGYEARELAKARTWASSPETGKEQP